MNPYTNAVTKKAIAQGITQLHFHIEDIKKQELTTLNGEIEFISASNETLVLIEGEYNGYIGSAYTEDCDESTIMSLLENIIQTATQNKVPYIEKSIHTLNVPTNRSIPFNTKEIAEKLITAEKTARESVKNIEVFRSGLVHHQKTITLVNSDGKSMSDMVSYFSVSTNIMTKDGEQTQSARKHMLFESVADVDLTAFIIKAAREASQMLNSQPCASGNYKVVLQNNVTAELFGAFLPAFQADKCQNKMSFLMDKLGDVVSSTHFIAYEDPSSLIHRCFDDEGTLTSKKALINEGKLSNYFHNNDTGQKAKQQSTGNGFRQNYNESISSAYTNVVIKIGKDSLTDLIKNTGSGILITSCDGIFAGVNPTSGDFSVISKGYMIKDGALAEPISGITIGGTLFDILSATEECGNDSITINSNTGIVSAPSIRLSSVVVTGV
ncbi:MAG: TldD/PmbA family protein [Defluviitaleaceae bacterium]|nr:TldD/PmbA family protein [Defluviitaleaceae bacterium]